MAPSDVTEGKTPLLKCLVVDCPNKHFLHSLMENETIAGIGKTAEVPYVFHFTPRKVREKHIHAFCFVSYKTTRL